MTTVSIKPTLLKSALIGERARAQRALKPAALAAARRFTRHLVQLTDSMGKTDLGTFKNAWRYEATDKGATTFNDAPYAGVIELGARPHPVSREGVELITQWVMRKMRIGYEGRDERGRYVKGRKNTPKNEREAKAKAIAWAIVQKIKTQGQAPTYMVRDALPQARKFFAEEFARIMSTNQVGSRVRK